MSWNIPNHPLPYKSTTPWPLAWLPTSFNPNSPKQWTCLSIVSVVLKIKNSLAHIGTQVPLT
eukprot:CCRYP_020489-RB/>CCRYP_020489-RB protein AED:0.45 eAED:0.45 QI:0/-1/0/1/-1/0/1/0/61